MSGRITAAFNELHAATQLSYKLTNATTALSAASTAENATTLAYVAALEHEISRQREPS
jgi:hypothetical protein